MSWPQEYHGREASLVEWVIFEEEYYRAGAPGRVSQNGIFLLAPIIFDHGTQEQQDRFLPTMAHRRADLGAVLVRARGRLRPGLAASRPHAATTSAAAGCSTARRPGRSRASYAHWGFGLFRSDPEAERHHGLTYFLFPLDADGVTVRPIAQLDGEAGFAEVFFEDVFVPDADVLGAPGDGWRVAMSTAGNERGLSLRSPGRFCAAADRLVDLYARAGSRSHRRASATASSTRGSRRRPTGSTPGARSPGSPTAARWARPARSTRSSGPSSTSRCTRPRSTCSAPRPRSSRRWLDGYLFSLSGPIYAGTNEIQRNIIAERILGLPREPKGAATMRFELTADQRDFAASLDSLLAVGRHRRRRPRLGRRRPRPGPEALGSGSPSRA